MDAGMVHANRSRQLLIAVVALLGVLSLFPLGWLGWVRSFHNLHTLLTAPIAGPLSSLSRLALPAKTSGLDDEGVRAFEEKIEELDSTLKRTMLENQRLRRELADLRVYKELNPGVSFWTITAPVIGSASDVSSGVVRVKAGSNRGVTVASVATGPGLQLVGRVTGVSPATSVVLPITARNAGPLVARVMLTEALDSTDGLSCTLSPVGDGTLAGPVQDRRLPGTATAIRPVPGQVVRLDDPGRWPASAQMTLVGVVERVDADPVQPLRSIVVVRPIIDRLDRLAEVTLRLSNEDEAEGGRR
jgi:hypothetical protein